MASTLSSASTRPQAARVPTEPRRNAKLYPAAIEDMLRDVAFVLHLTERVKSDLLSEPLLPVQA